MAAPRPRVPPPEPLELLGEQRTIQVNHCKVPTCKNFGVPARHEPQKPGPSKDRDPAYKVHTTSAGQVQSLRCKSCGDNPPMKSNAAIALEAQRLVEADGLLLPEESASCPNTHCDNHGRSVAQLGRDGYHRRGRTADGRGRCYACKACGRRFTVSNPVRLHDGHRRIAADLFSRIANKSPGRGTVRGAGLKSHDSYYAILRFLHGRCRSHSGAVDRALADGRLRLPDDINLQSDAQEFTLNWTSRFDRRNVVLSSYSTVDAESGFILGMHVNFDGQVDPFEIHRDAARCGDFRVPEAFRKHARLWLTGDDIAAGRAAGRKLRKHDRVALLEQIRRLYAKAERRSDVEDVELECHDPAYRQLPALGRGMQTHLPCTAYAHWMLMRRILIGAGVNRVQANMDECSMSRAAFLAAFAEEVRCGDAHGFYVRYTKYQTIDERRTILSQAEARREAFRRTLPEPVRGDAEACARLMMLANLDAGMTVGKWRDEWFEHPSPTINEPHKAMCWLTPDWELDEGRMADMFLRAGLARVDNVFMKARRLFSALERPVGTSSGHNTVWHGYAPYNPAMLGTYLTLFRTVHNFVSLGSDGRTPAMRLGFAREPFRYEDILWPGEPVPRPKRVRRRGRRLALPA